MSNAAFLVLLFDWSLFGEHTIYNIQSAQSIAVSTVLVIGKQCRTADSCTFGKMRDDLGATTNHPILIAVHP